jgi:hypothetical protein
MSGAAIFVLFLFVAVGSGLLLYLFVRAEHDQRQPMDRESAEKVARRDVPDDSRNADEDDRNTERETDRFG